MELQRKTVGLVVNAPEIFKRADFLAWLNNRKNVVFTWHKKGTKPGEYSDVVVLVDSNYEGDSSGMPEDIWHSICDLAYGEFCDGEPKLPPRITSHITVRLTNLN